MRISIRFLLFVIAVIAIGISCYIFGVRQGVNQHFTQLDHGSPSSNGYRARIRVIASDTLEPVVGAEFQTIMIGADGGDGGYNSYVTDGNGCLVTTEYLYPGRYQISISPPAQSRYDVTQYGKQETYLVVRDDGTYSPSEFRINPKNAN